MTRLHTIIALLWLFTITVIGVTAQEAEMPKIPYYQSPDLNVPVLNGWENQSTDTVAQFYNSEAQATIRTTVVSDTDSEAGAKADLEAFLDTTLDEPLYSDKVNLADGTWSVLIYSFGDDGTASVMSRPVDGRVYVVSFIETNPDAQIYMVAIARPDDNPEDDPTAEIATALDALGMDTSEIDSTDTLALSSGEWQLQTYDDDISAMGFIFGNDSYVVVADGTVENLPELANAYNSTVLGFFVTPNNSGYLILGLAVVIGVLLLLVLSIVWRYRNLEEDLATIQQLAQDA